MSLLGQFEHHYSTLTAEITAKIGRLSFVGPEEVATGVRNVEKQLVEVGDLLDQMELAVRELPAGPDRTKYDTRVKSYRTDSDQLKNELKKAVLRLRESSSRDELFAMDGFGTNDDTLLTEEHRSQLMRNTESLERASRKLDDGYRVAVETEQIGADTLNDLELQRGVINRAQGRLREAEDDLGQSSKILSNMIRRVIQNRALLLLVASILLLVVGVVIYFAFR